MTTEERAFNYASTQKPTKLQVGEIAKHYNNGYQQAIKDFMEKAEKWLEIHMPLGQVSHESVYDCIQEFKNYMQNESED